MLMHFSLSFSLNQKVGIRMCHQTQKANDSETLMLVSLNATSILAIHVWYRGQEENPGICCHWKWELVFQSLSCGEMCLDE